MLVTKDRETYMNDRIELHRGLQDYIQGIMSKVEELQVFLYMTIIFHSFKGRFINLFFFSFGNIFLFKALTLFLKFFFVLKSFECFEYAGFSDMRQTWKTSPKSSRKSSGGVFSHVSSFITDLSVLVCLHI